MQNYLSAEVSGNTRCLWKKGDDHDAAGSLYEIISAVKLSVSRSMHVGAWYIGGSITESELNDLNNELNAGRWVVACVITGASGHAFVINGYNSVTDYYTIWDPWDNLSKTVTKNQLCNNMITLDGSGTLYTLNAVVFCR